MTTAAKGFAKTRDAPADNPDDAGVSRVSHPTVGPARGQPVLLLNRNSAAKLRPLSADGLDAQPISNSKDCQPKPSQKGGA